jgi:hypothetical protein
MGFSGNNGGGGWVGKEGGKTWILTNPVNEVPFPFFTKECEREGIAPLEVHFYTFQEVAKSQQSRACFPSLRFSGSCKVTATQRLFY